MYILSWIIYYDKCQYVVSISTLLQCCWGLANCCWSLASHLANNYKIYSCTCSSFNFFPFSHRIVYSISLSFSCCCWAAAASLWPSTIFRVLRPSQPFPSALVLVWILSILCRLRVSSYCASNFFLVADSTLRKPRLLVLL